MKQHNHTKHDQASLDKKLVEKLGGDTSMLGMCIQNTTYAFQSGNLQKGRWWTKANPLSENLFESVIVALRFIPVPVIFQKAGKSHREKENETNIFERFQMKKGRNWAYERKKKKTGECWGREKLRLRREKQHVAHIQNHSHTLVIRTTWKLMKQERRRQWPTLILFPLL